MTEETRQGGPEYRGVILPDGMTPRCLDDLASLINDYGDGLLKIGGKEADHRDAAVMVFEVVRRALVETAFPPSQRNAS